MLALVMAVVTVAGSPPASDPGRCTRLSTYESYVRKHTETWTVSRALPDIVTDSSGFRPSFAGDTVPAGPMQGRLVRIESVRGVGSDDLAAPGQVVVVFLWSYGPDCLSFSHTHVPPDSLSHYTMTLRGRGDWVGDRPTFDVSPFGLGRYPTGFASEQEFLDVHGYAEMVSLIPDETEWAEDCRPGITRLFHWMRSHRGPFPRMTAGLVTLCEQNLARKASGFIRRGGEIPPWVATWASATQCRIDSWWGNRHFNAIEGRFLSEADEQWAVLCATHSAWRLVVLDPETRTENVELARFVGSADDWTIGVYAPGYFVWSPVGDFPGDPQGPPVPERDALYLTNGTTTVFYHDGERWQGLYNECCYWNLDDDFWLEESDYR